MQHTVLFLCCVVLFTGCVTEAPRHADTTHVWYKPDATSAMLREDLASCRGEAGRQRSGLPNYDGIVVTLSENNRLDQIVFDCMTAKGYVLTNREGSSRTR